MAPFSLDATKLTLSPMVEDSISRFPASKPSGNHVGARFSSIPREASASRKAAYSGAFSPAWAPVAWLFSSADGTKWNTSSVQRPIVPNTSIPDAWAATIPPNTAATAITATSPCLSHRRKRGLRGGENSAVFSELSSDPVSQGYREVSAPSGTL